MAKNDNNGGGKPAAVIPPLFVARDIDGFFGLFIDNLVNLLIVVTTLKFVFNMPDQIVYGRVVPGAAVSILAGNFIYTLMARRLAKREGRTDVTALPYGISTPIMFAYLFLIIGPVYWSKSAMLIADGVPETVALNQAATLAWKVGVASTLIGGIIEAMGAFFGPFIRRVTPRAALLGTLAGIAITFIAMKPTLGIFEHPEVGFLPLAIILIGFIARVVFPFSIPAGFMTILLGTVLAWAIGFQNSAKVHEAVQAVGLHVPRFYLKDLIQGFQHVVPYLVVVLPMGIYNFLETMQNTESAAAAGDNYDTRQTMIVDGAGTMVGALLGSCFPTTVYIGHPGWKAVGSRLGYTMINGVAIFIIAVGGLLKLGAAVIPKEVAFCILLYIGLVITAQAFQSSPRKHAPAVAIAFVPHLANFVKTEADKIFNVVLPYLNPAMLTGNEANVAAPSLKVIEGIGYDKFIQIDFLYKGLASLGSGAIVTGLLLGAITAFLIDKRFTGAASYAGAATVMAYFGIIHAPRVQVGAAPMHALGYLTLTVLFTLLRFYEKSTGKQLKFADEETH